MQLAAPGSSVGVLDEEVPQEMGRGRSHALPRQSLAQRRLEVLELLRRSVLEVDERRVEHEAQREDIACDVGLSARQLLGRRVQRRACGE